MAKRRMIVTDDQLLIDMDLFFNAVRDSEGKWEQVEADLLAYRDGVAAMSRGEGVEESAEPKERMLVTDDQLIIDVTLLFNAIREAQGNWEQVEKEMRSYLAMVNGMTA